MSTVFVLILVGAAVVFFLHKTVGYRKSFNESVDGVVVEVKTEQNSTLNPRTRHRQSWIGHRVVEFQWNGETVQSIDCRSREHCTFFPGDRVTVCVNPKDLKEVWIERST